MFKNLTQFWKGKDFLNQVLEEFKNMLNDAENMFRMVCEKLIDNKEIPDLKNEIYKIDKKINTSEKDIRKRIIEHLALRPSVDIPTSLILMSVVKDAERLGDYCKNLFEIISLLKSPINKAVYTNLFNNIETEILELFQQTKQAFLDSDEDKAAKSWGAKREIAIRCDKILKQLAISDLSVNEAVCFTLMARHFKRLASHLTNIATSVILPVTELDYFDEKRKEKE